VEVSVVYAISMKFMSGLVDVFPDRYDKIKFFSEHTFKALKNV
jgi:hypothetical protein